MPIFDYQCGDCGKTYDVYHKVREVFEDIICPTCGSKKYKKLISAPSVAISSGSRSNNSSCSTPNFGGGCSGGSCGI